MRKSLHDDRWIGIIFRNATAPYLRPGDERMRVVNDPQKDGVQFGNYRRDDFGVHKTTLLISRREAKEFALGHQE
jgi:hypothetical protein